MTNSDADVKQEALIFVQGKESVASNGNDFYPLHLVANIANSSDIISKQQTELSQTSHYSSSTSLPFLETSYQFLNTDMTSVGTAECSILLDEDSANMAKDSQIKNVKLRKLPCPKCSFQTADKTTLERHMRKHNSIFVCKVCKIHFPSVSSLIDHYSKRHLSETDNNTEAQHCCPMCPFSSIEKLEYDKHITRHETAAYLCQICGQPFAKQVSMKWHVKFKHNITDNDNDNDQIEDASENTECMNVKLSAEQMEPISMEDLQNELLDHEMEGEQEIKPFAKRFNCLFCSKSFSTKLVLRYHAWRSHRERLQMNQIQETLPQEPVPGPKSSTKNWNPSKRTRSNQFNCPYQCPICTFSTIYKSTFDRHVKKHGDAKYHCDICGMPFTVIGNLNHHKNVHHPELVPTTMQPPKRHKCSLCIYNTSYKSTLERHLRTHGIAKYHCDLCDMPFVFTGSFVTHRELKHQILSKNVTETVFPDKVTDDSKLTGGGKLLKRRKCPYCNMYMSSASKLNRHLRTHKNAGYFCGTCSIFYPLRLDFENHMRNHLQSRASKNGQQHQDTSQSPVNRLSQQVTVMNSNDEFDTSNTCSAQDRMVESEQNLVTDDLATFHNIIGETSNLNELPNSMVQLYDNQAANKPNINLVKIDLTEQQLSKASLISSHSLGSAQSESNRHFDESTASSLKIVSTCGSADQHNLGPSTMLDQGSIQNLYNPSGGLSGESYPMSSQTDTFQMENPNLFSSQRTNFNIGPQSFVPQVYAANNQNLEMSQKESFTVSRANQKQQQQQQFLSPSSVEQNLQREVTNSDLSHCNQQQQLLSREDNDSDLCACKIIQPVHGEVLANPPFKGRYAKLVSDFDDFALRPFACSLCFFRCSVLKDLYSHVQNHLTGCNMTPTPVSAKFNAGPYLQGLAPQGETTNHSHHNVPDIEYID